MFLEKIKNLQSDGYWGDYSILIDMFEFKIVVQDHDNDYQGDSRYLFKNLDTGEFGFLNFGWGSCSGCDALQACNSDEDVNDLTTDLYNSIRWFPTATEAYEYFVNHDWKGDYGYSETFVEECKRLLEIETVDKILLEDNHEL